MNDLTFTDKGFADYVYWQFEDRKTVKRINNLLEDIKIISCRGHYDD